eukprot:GILJ01001235.1.p1 GENE.GILJ01001235.1~~GILJ01001235.1.p1  ORF type:complete len:125 (+),score=15.72 GILJ01001235.1:50-424(+)
MRIVPVIQRKVVDMPFWPENVKRMLNHPAGPFTIHFWAPAFKWAITLSNIADMQRPADKISYPQQFALLGTGIIWSRYSTQVIPKNWTLLSVNLFMALSAGAQLYRKYMFELERKERIVSSPQE